MGCWARLLLVVALTRVALGVEADVWAGVWCGWSCGGWSGADGDVAEFSFVFRGAWGGVAVDDADCGGDAFAYGGSGVAGVGAALVEGVCDLVCGGGGVWDDH